MVNPDLKMTRRDFTDSRTLLVATERNRMHRQPALYQEEGHVVHGQSLGLLILGRQTWVLPS